MTMKKIFLYAVVALLPVAGYAQCPAFSPVDVFLNFNGASAGTTVTTANLQASTEGTGGTWSTANSLMSLQASKVALPGSVSVNGGAAHGCGYATQSMAIIENTPGPGHTSELDFYNSKTQVVTSGWIVNLPPNQGGAGDLFDYIVYESASNAGSGVTQIQPGTGLTCTTGTPPFMEMEAYDGSTNHSLPCIPVPASGTVYFSHLMNYGTTGNCNGTASGNVSAPCEGIYVYTTSGTTFTKIGSAAIQLDGSDSQGLMLFGNNETASFTGTSYFQNIMIDWTNHVWPNLPTGGGTSYGLTVSTAGTGTGTVGGSNCSTGTYSSGTTITCTETPGSGSTFSGWSGGSCSGTGSCSFSIAATSTVTATFNASGSTPLWNGILSTVPTCNLGTASVANPCGIQWQGNVGVPGGADALSNSAVQCGSTIAAGATQTTINSALTACGGTSSQQKYVLLAAGTFPLTGTVKVPSYDELRGTLGSGGTLSTLQLNSGSYDTCEPYTSGDTCGVALGEDSGLSNIQVAITGGATAGSTSITLASTSGMSATNGYLAVTETNAAWVSAEGDEGDCSWCDGGLTADGSRARAQIVKITNISGNTVTLAAPGLFTAYTNTPTAVYFTASAQYPGLRDVQLYAENVGLGANVVIGGSAYAYMKGVEHNYTDGNWWLAADAYRPEIRDGYHSNSFDHGAGTFDGDGDLSMRTTLALVENNIFERGHNAVMEEWGPSGNVVAYNYAISGYDNSGYNSTYGGFNDHGAHPQFNLTEGNIVPTIKLDSVWGSNSHNVDFRNWVQQTSKVCTPYTTNGRTTVTTPCFQSPYQTVGEQFDFLSQYGNSVNDVIGSAQLIALGQTNLVSVAWISGTANRNMFDNTSWGYTRGFGADASDGSGTGCDGGTSPCYSTAPNLTSFAYNTYVAGPASTVCTSGGSTASCTAASPASFYLPSKPSWWGSLPFPGNGVDVAGGTGPAGHANLNPAANCFLNIMGGTDGSVGSPYAFNEATCYPSGPAPTPPTGLTGTVVVRGAVTIQ